RVERLRASAEGLRLRQLGEHAPEDGRRGGTEPKRVPPQHVAFEAIGGGAGALADDEHAEVAPREQRRGDEGAERATENDDVVVLLRHHRVPLSPLAVSTPRTRTRGRPPAFWTSSTL